ncbi:ATP-binding protein [Candidatus Poribacteria bacterium]|nr:MAG: ATP-binding protein [Candidatus Poribacteria bacterium]
MGRKVKEEWIWEALKKAKHPETGKSLVELGMIRDVKVKGGRVRLTVALPFKNVPVKDQIVENARKAVEGVEGVEEVEVELVEMTPRERSRFMEVQEGRTGAAKGMNEIDRVIAVMSGKGGVGKSLVAGLLAVELRRKGFKVGVLDADITGPSIPKMFLPFPKRPEVGPQNAVIPVETDLLGIKLISINLFLPSEDEAVIWRGPLIGNAIKQFWDEVLWGELDYLIVDLPPGTSDAPLTVMQALPLTGVVLVTSPQELAGMVVRKAARMAQRLNVPLLGLVENMSYVVCPKCGERIEIFGPSRASAIANAFDIPFLGRLPIDPTITRLCDEGWIEKYPSERFGHIVEELLKSIEKLEG